MPRSLNISGAEVATASCPVFSKGEHEAMTVSRPRLAGTIKVWENNTQRQSAAFSFIFSTALKHGTSLPHPECLVLHNQCTSPSSVPLKITNIKKGGRGRKGGPEHPPGQEAPGGQGTWGRRGVFWFAERILAAAQEGTGDPGCGAPLWGEALGTPMQTV